ncbi:MAG: molybdopterin-guanine dinucleotide biosynthesis protein B [Planctomycetaceae bacterium]|nr:molybdopterin-guanine dinucleotide biosynthesis protein B [Planctomycetaceae bacterium]
MPRDLVPPRVHIVGRRNSGKTTLICELIAAISQQGLNVGSIKHTPHRHEFDHPGKDSHRHRAAGACAAGIISPDAGAVFWTIPPEYDREQRYAALLRMYVECDIVLVEGDTQTAAPKVEVWRSAVGLPPFASEGLAVHAVISDDTTDLAPELWPRADIHGLSRNILRLASRSPRLDQGLPAGSQHETQEDAVASC